MSDLSDELHLTWRSAEARFARACKRVGMNPEARELVDYLLGPDTGSGTRGIEFLVKVSGLPTHVFWPVFLRLWNIRGGGWSGRKYFLELLRWHANRQWARPYMENGAAAFFDRLPALVSIYRGCARYRLRGLSWTTDRQVAMTFACR